MRQKFTVLILTIIPFLLGSTHEVPKTPTPVTSVELAEILASSHEEVFGWKPKPTTLSIAWAQVAIENARGKAIYNHNYGNLGVRKSRPYYRVAGSRFESFPSKEQGAKRYWKHLKERCSTALAHFRVGNVHGASKYLKSCGYYGVEEEFYRKNLQQLSLHATKNVLPKLSKNQ